MPNNPNANRNLRKGAVHPTQLGTIRAGIQARLRREERITGLIEHDPMAGLKVTWEMTTTGLLRLVEKWLRQGGMPNKDLLDAMKEYRQQTRAVTEWIQAEGLAAATDTFIAEWVAEINGQAAKASEDVVEDPQMNLVRLHDMLSRGANRLVAKWGRQRQYPQRVLTEVLSEVRQTAQAVAEYRRSSGVTSESEHFVATMATRLAQANLGAGIRSYHSAA